MTLTRAAESIAVPSRHLPLSPSRRLPSSWRRRCVRIIGGLVLALAIHPAGAQMLSDTALQVELVTSGLVQPTSMAFIGDGDILVLQKADGRVRRILNGALQPGAVLDVAVHSSSERGLLGIATDPDFIHTRQVFLYYTESSTGGDTSSSGSTPLGNRVYRYSWNGATLVDPLLILDLPATPGPNHDGGVIAFGPDDALHTVIGELNRNGRLQNYPNGPAPDDTGVILRTDARGLPLSDNPFFDPADPDNPLGRYLAYGVRNSFGMAFDPWSGTLWDSENGPSSYDEINRVVPGFNSGWESIMGPDARDPQGTGDLWMAPGAVYRDPEFSWAVPVAPAGVAFAASPILGCGLAGDLLVGDNNCGQIYRFRLAPGRDALVFSSPALADAVADNGSMRCSQEMAEILFGSGFGVVSDLENGPDGRLYLVSLTAGAVYRIGPRPGAVPDADGDAVADACDCAPGDAGSFARPATIARLRLGGGMIATLGWDPQAATAGPGTRYRLVTGPASRLGSEGGFASACTLRDDLTSGDYGDVRADPPQGEAWYYLARAENACGNGGFGGSGSNPDPRDLIETVPPLSCTAD